MKRSLAKGRKVFKELRRSNVFLLLLLLVIVGSFVSFADAQRQSHSVEVGFTSLSPNGEEGGRTVPASCNGGPDAANAGQQCSGSNQCGTLYGTYDTCGNCSVGGPTVPGNYGQVCNSAPNACGWVNQATIDCNGNCPASPPANPWYLGVQCSSAPNACGAVNYGTYDCNAVCSAGAPPALPANYGAACVSSPNYCGQTGSGTIQCNGSCSGTTPPNSNCPPSQQPPSISVSPTTLLTGQTTTVTWSCPGNTSATGTNFSTGGAASGSATVTVNTTTTFTVNCQEGTSANAQVTVTGPALSLSASPTRVRMNAASSLTWSASSVTSCTLTGPGINISKAANGSGIITQQVTSTGAITGQSTYTLTCQSSSGAVSNSVTINLIPSEQEI